MSNDRARGPGAAFVRGASELHFEDHQHAVLPRALGDELDDQVGAVLRRLDLAKGQVCAVLGG